MSVSGYIAVLLALALSVSAVMATPPTGRTATVSSTPAAWRKPVKPFRIVGDIYYVGSEGLAAYLIKSPQGAILLDGTLAENAAMIERNIEALGVPLNQVKLLLSDHAHNDHVGALAQIKRDTGASLAAGAGDRWALEHGQPPGQVDYTPFPFPPVKVDRAVRDEETVQVGPNVLTAHSTPGHTPGCTSWSMTVQEGGRPVDVIFLCSITVAGNVLVGNTAYPGIVDDFRSTFAKLAATKTDVVLTSHPEIADVLGREARWKPGQPNPFIDPVVLAAIVATARENFGTALKTARAAR